jgi:hypothetical protein
MKRLERLKVASLCASLIFAFSLRGFGQESTFFSNWPARLSPQEVGKRVAEHFVTSPHQYGPTIHYSEVATDRLLCSGRRPRCFASLENATYEEGHFPRRIAANRRFPPFQKKFKRFMR